MRLKTNLFLIFIFLLFSISFAYSQDYNERDRKQFYEIGKKFYSDYLILPDKSPDSIRVIVMFRYTYDMLVFAKSNQKQMSNGAFYAIQSIEIEFKDETGIIRKREKLYDTIFVKTYDDIKSKTDYLFGSVESVLQNNNYSVIIRIQGANVQSSQTKLLTKIENFYYFKKPTIGKPICVDNFDINSTSILTPFIIDSNCRFTSKGARIVVPVSYSNVFEKYNYSIKSYPKNKKILSWDKNISISDISIPARHQTLSLSKASSGNNVELNIITFNDSNITNKNIYAGILNIEFPADKIVPGSYRLTLNRDGSKDSLIYDFDVVWLNMPLILTKPEIASDVMYYILTDEEFNLVKKGNEDEILMKILQYWQKHDPTPGTTYNEAMAEFFKRADYSLFNFQTTNQHDGSKTDRGKIYILYGPPDNSDRTLANDKTIEKWDYKKLKKTLTFETNSNSDFKLVKIIDIK